ncbi:MBL fold metallo-hydrolase [Pseudonocardiaceae bacterium YIM PH 21723]|nr:MBL fold metallo-hydrolase [Pseudonocardiaceae bacterium YIM PH 21723]
MHLTILGCSGSVPGPNAAASGYLLEAENFLLVMDLGNGTLASLQQHCDPFEIGALLFSHLHPDHCSDFSALAVWRRYQSDPPYNPTEQPLPVYGPHEAPARFAAMYAPSESERLRTDLTDVFAFRPLDQGTFTVGPFQITAVPVNHLGLEAYGFRVTDGDRTLAYTGDTGPCPELLELADGVDVFLSEATWPHSDESPGDVHLSALQAGAVAADAGARRLFLTHLAPLHDPDEAIREAESVFTGPLELVEQGKTYEI